MGVIHVLSESVANKIAAGEVIERPSSIVKELIENSLDAGASSVEIEIANGGKNLIRVADNGSGMSAEDAELAFRRHATSKISDADELFSIATFGFRGEALPSIAAVSRVKLTTRVKSLPSGTELSIDGGALTEARECPCAPGTTVEVRDLFFNTPARRKFLKADATELGHVMDVVSNFSLAHPSLRIVFKSSDRTVFDLSPTEKLLERAESVLGEAAAKHFMTIDEEANGIRISGLIGKPFAARANRSGQTFFVNRRCVRSPILSHGLQAGFHGLLMHGQFAAAVIFVDLDLTKVDVNVHPSKHEVRISNEKEVKSLLIKVVASALKAESDINPELKDFRGKAPEVFVPSAAGFRNDPVSVVAREIAAAREKEIREPGEAFFAADPGAGFFAVAETERASQELISVSNKLKITKILGQIHHTFILAETEDGFMIIDQHAAHERIMFESLKQGFESGAPARQNLLMDEVLELHPRQLETFRESLALLDRIGFTLEEFGENSFVVRAYPSTVNENPVTFLKAYLEEKEEGKSRTRLEDYQEEIAAMIACKKSSVKAHDYLSIDKLYALTERLARCENPFSCPHGRPAFFNKSFYELEKQFKRK